MAGQDHAKCVTPTTNWATGSSGQLTLYIRHPFVGALTIPKTTIFGVYGTKKAGVYGSIPMSEVTLTGEIDVAQGCELQEGSTLEIPFGDYQAHDFKGRKGLMPVGGRKITKEITFSCLNISDGVKIFLHIEGPVNQNDSRAIDLGNPDVGAIVENELTGNVLIPNDINYSEELVVGNLYDNVHRNASAVINVYPISTTGKLPAAGNFDGIASLRIDVE